MAPEPIFICVRRTGGTKTQCVFQKVRAGAPPGGIFNAGVGTAQFGEGTAQRGEGAKTRPNLFLCPMFGLKGLFLPIYRLIGLFTV